MWKTVVGPPRFLKRDPRLLSPRIDEMGPPCGLRVGSARGWRPRPPAGPRPSSGWPNLEPVTGLDADVVLAACLMISSDMMRPAASGAAAWAQPAKSTTTWARPTSPRSSEPEPGDLPRPRPSVPEQTTAARWAGGRGPRRVRQDGGLKGRGADLGFKSHVHPRGSTQHGVVSHSGRAAAECHFPIGPSHSTGFQGRPGALPDSPSAMEQQYMPAVGRLVAPRPLFPASTTMERLPGLESSPPGAVREVPPTFKFRARRVRGDHALAPTCSIVFDTEVARRNRARGASASLDEGRSRPTFRRGRAYVTLPGKTSFLEPNQSRAASARRNNIIWGARTTRTRTAVWAGNSRRQPRRKKSREPCPSARSSRHRSPTTNVGQASTTFR